MLFVLTSAVYVSALIPAGLPRATVGLADPRDPLLILAPAAVGILVLVCATPRRPATARISGPIRSLSTAANVIPLRSRRGCAERPAGRAAAVFGGAATPSCWAPAGVVLE